MASAASRAPQQPAARIPVALLTKCSVIGGLILFAWAAFSWMVLPFHEQVLTAFQNEGSIRDAVAANAPASGIYVFPYGDSEAAQKQMLQGPIVFASIRREGIGGMGTMMLVSLLVQMVCAKIATLMLLPAAYRLSYSRRVVFFTLAGLLIGLAGHVPSMVWWSFAPAYVALEIVDLVIAWSLAGLAIARFVK